MSKLVIVDSNCANLSSVYRASLAAGLTPQVSGETRDILTADAIIFPGVGSFNHAVQALRKQNLITVLQEYFTMNKPFLGICLGMQLLFDESEESTKSNDKDCAGFHLFSGRVVRFTGSLPVPHVGWNQVAPVKQHPLFAGLDEQPYFYFTHSYYVSPEKPNDQLALTNYGNLFVSAVAKDRIMGVQFHPEKSGTAGLRLLANFGNIIAD